MNTLQVSQTLLRETETERGRERGAAAGCTTGLTISHTIHEQATLNAKMNTSTQVGTVAPLTNVAVGRASLPDISTDTIVNWLQILAIPRARHRRDAPPVRLYCVSSM